jgi:hypothetical protein
MGRIIFPAGVYTLQAARKRLKRVHELMTQIREVLR